MNLKEARAKNALDQFAKERAKDAPGNRAVLAKTINAMASKKKKPTSGTSGRRSRAD